jgi:hypothetical protein
VFDELCKCTACFFTSCMFPQSCLMQAVFHYSLVIDKYDSPLGFNALFCCDLYGWSYESFLMNLVKLNNCIFEQSCLGKLCYSNITHVMLLMEVLFFRVGYFYFQIVFVYPMHKSVILLPCLPQSNCTLCFALHFSCFIVSCSLLVYVLSFVMIKYNNNNNNCLIESHVNHGQ